MIAADVGPVHVGVFAGPGHPGSHPNELELFGRTYRSPTAADALERRLRRDELVVAGRRHVHREPVSEPHGSARFEPADTCQRCQAEEQAALRAGTWPPVRWPATTTEDGLRVCDQHAGAPVSDAI